MATFQTLPYDIFVEIARHLDFRSVLSIASASRFLHQTIDPLIVTPDAARRTFFLEAEKYKQHRNPNKLTCFACWRLRPADAFGRTQLLGHKGKWCWSNTYASRRFCWYCGASKRLYVEGTALRKGKFLWYLCYTCGEYNLKSQKCQREVTVGEDGVKKRVTVCAKKVQRVWSVLEEALPVVFLLRFFGLLAYRDLIMLAQTSSHFHRAVEPASAPLRDKARFLRSQFDRRTENAELPCFSCFSLKPRRRRGPWRQRAWDPAQRCNACAWQMSLATPDELARREERSPLASCPFCKDLMHQSDFVAGEGCCLECLEANGRKEKRDKIREERRKRKDRTVADDEGVLGAVMPMFGELEEQAVRVEEARQNWAEELRRREGNARERFRSRLDSDSTSAAEQWSIQPQRTRDSERRRRMREIDRRRRTRDSDRRHRSVGAVFSVAVQRVQGLILSIRS